MPENHIFHTRTALAEGLRELLKKLEDHLSLSKPVNAYLAGGMAVHLYTASRVTSDVDAEFGCRVILPSDLAVEVALENGERKVVYMDTNYNSSFALMPKDYQEDAVLVDLGLDKIRVYVLSPVDLAVSKIARFADNDREDIAELTRLGLVTADDIKERATNALDGYIGNINALKLNILDATELARRVEANYSQSEPYRARSAVQHDEKLKAQAPLSIEKKASEPKKEAGERHDNLNNDLKQK